MMPNKSKKSLSNLNFNRCRICLLSEDEIDDEILNVCACRGSAGSVHLDCLETWLKMTNRTHCEICFQPYQIVRQPLYGILSSIPAFINENTFYKWGCGYFVAAVALFAFVMSYVIEYEFASWDYALFFCTIIIFFALSAFATAVKEWSSWRREQYKLTPRHRSKK